MSTARKITRGNPAKRPQVRPAMRPGTYHGDIRLPQFWLSGRCLAIQNWVQDESGGVALVDNQCWMNASFAARDVAGLTYAEGVAGHILGADTYRWTYHGWCVDADGAVETLWEEPASIYVGFTYSNEQVAEMKAAAQGMDLATHRATYTDPVRGGDMGLNPEAGNTYALMETFYPLAVQDVVASVAAGGWSA